MGQLVLQELIFDVSEARIGGYGRTINTVLLVDGGQLETEVCGVLNSGVQLIRLQSSNCHFLVVKVVVQSHLQLVKQLDRSTTFFSHHMVDEFGIKSNFQGS